MNALEIARESLARQAEENGAPFTAKLYREGKQDEGGIMPAALGSATLACDQAEREIGELAVLAAEYLFRRDQYRDRDSSTNLDNMSFAEDQLRKHPLVEKQLGFYEEKQS
jgi:hypothetical protein